jgi:radical SAM superfamily enzyme YgiQ (UPF0313 family)
MNGILKKHKLLLIKPSQLFEGSPLKLKMGLTPTRALPYLAALTPDTFEVTIVDESIQDLDFDEQVDLVGITSLIPQVPRAIQIADEYRRRGVKVIMGGIGASSVPDDVLPHVDALVIGEADLTWKLVLEDYLRGSLKKVYKSSEFCTMQSLPVPRFDLIDSTGYVQAGMTISKSNKPRLPIETARGCPYSCSFCSVATYFGHHMRNRPIDEVIAEMKHFPDSYFFLVDDNICGDRQRAKALFSAMAPLGNRWLGQFSTAAAHDEELLTLARKAGCINAYVGIESFSKNTLKSVKKHANLAQDVRTTFRAFKNAGIDMNVSLIVGLDGDTPESIREMTDFVIQQKVHLISMYILIPLPGTQLFKQFQEEGRILTYDYSLYDGTHVVYKPSHMSPEVLQETYWKEFERFYSFPNTIRRFSDCFSWAMKGFIVPVIYTYGGTKHYRKGIRQRIHPLSLGRGRRS